MLEERLRRRSAGHATEEQLHGRLQTARREVDACRDYEYVVVNEDVEVCIEQMRGIVVAERARTPVMRGRIEDIVATFRSD